MTVKTTSIVMSLCIAASGLGAEQAVTPPSQPRTAARPCWHKAPTVSVMTGFIYEPLSRYTLQKWMENLGHKFDADRWVKNFQEAGASHVVFYDKWIDGLVFHETKTTHFKTQRDFLRELAAACQRRGLPLVLYFNAISDGNPEFDEWCSWTGKANRSCSALPGRRGTRRCTRRSGRSASIKSAN